MCCSGNIEKQNAVSTNTISTWTVLFCQIDFKTAPLGCLFLSLGFNVNINNSLLV